MVDISRPEPPNLLNSKGLPTATTSDRTCASSCVANPGSTGMRCPSIFFNSGLFSKVSTWLTPPDMKRKMQFLAFGGWWGGFPGGRVEAWEFSDSSAARARLPSPLKLCSSICRREVSLPVSRSINIDELVGVEQDAANSRQAFAFCEVIIST